MLKHFKTKSIFEFVQISRLLLIDGNLNKFKSFKKKLHEIKNEIDRFFKNMGGHLSLYYLVFVPVWWNIVCDALVSENTPAHCITGTVDGVYRFTRCWRSYPSIFKKKKQLTGLWIGRDEDL